MIRDNYKGDKICGCANVWERDGVIVEGPRLWSSGRCVCAECMQDGCRRCHKDLECTRGILNSVTNTLQVPAECLGDVASPLVGELNAGLYCDMRMGIFIQFDVTANVMVCDCGFTAKQN